MTHNQIGSNVCTANLFSVHIAIAFGTVLYAENMQYANLIYDCLFEIMQNLLYGMLAWVVSNLWLEK
jgi:hypothetical protein